MNLKNQYVWHSISDLARDLKESEHISGRNTVSDEDRSSDWSDTDSFEEAYNRMVRGYEYEEVTEAVGEFRSVATGQRSRSYQDVVGHQVIVPLYLQGIPTNMVNKRPVVDNKIVTIVYETSAPHGVSSDRIMETTKELFAKIVNLEAEGYRCNVWVIETNGNEDGKWGFALKLKTDRETLNFKKMMFPLVSSSFLRRIGFRIKERLYKDWIGGGYGRAVLDEELVSRFMAKNLGIRKYELWNYRGMQS